MAKKAELLAEAQELGLELNDKNTVAEITAAIESKKSDTPSEELANKGEEGVPEIQAVAEQADEEVTPESTEEPKTAKAGKRSAKALAEAEEKAAKELRKHSDDSEEESKPKQVQRTRSKLERSSKNYRASSEKVEKGKEYSLKEALVLAKETSTVKFDASVELHVRLNVDPKQADQNIRESLVLPNGTGKSVRVAVFGEADDVAEAKKAGADIAGSDEFLQQLDKGEINFDVLVATPQVMSKLGKYARVLGPKGLMPNPKSGTVTKDVAKAVEQAKAGKVELRVDETGIIHLSIGKVSFDDQKLLENAQAVFSTLKSAKPGSIKGSFVNTIYATTSMGPSIKIAPSEM